MESALQAAEPDPEPRAPEPRSGIAAQRDHIGLPATGAADSPASHAGLNNIGPAARPKLRRPPAQGEITMLKFLGKTTGIIFLIGLLVVIGLLMLIF